MKRDLLREVLSLLAYKPDDEKRTLLKRTWTSPQCACPAAGGPKRKWFG